MKKGFTDKGYIKYLEKELESQSCEGGLMRDILRRIEPRTVYAAGFKMALPSEQVDALVGCWEIVSEELATDDGEMQAAALSEIDR